MQAEEDKAVSSTRDSEPSAVANTVVKHFGSVIGCEGMANSPSLVRPATMVRRTYTARANSVEPVEALYISYADLRARVIPLLSRTSRASVTLGDEMVRTLIAREIEGMPVRPTVPTLASILNAQREAESTTRDGNTNDDANTLPRANCKYTDSDLLLHPLFQKVRNGACCCTHSRVASMPPRSLISFLLSRCHLLFSLSLTGVLRVLQERVDARATRVLARLC